MKTVRELLGDARVRLAATSESAALDSEVLLAHVLGRDRSWLYAWPEYHPDAARLEQFASLLEQRLLGHPVSHLTGEREFWSLSLRVSPDTLIPRPETEQLVAIVLALDLPADARVLDLGTGSGAIALAIAHERPAWRVNAVDRSGAALAVAGDNARQLGLERVAFGRGDWLDAVPANARFDLIVANPPYIAADDPHLHRGDVRFEPQAALVSGSDGLDDIRRIVQGAAGHLTANGWLWLEHGHQQGEQVAELLRQRGYREVGLRRDLAGHGRHCGGRTPRDKASTGH